MIGSTSGSHFESALSRSASWSGSIQCCQCQNFAPWVSISSSRTGENHRGRGPMGREGGGRLSYSYRPKTAAQRATHEPECFRDSGPRICCDTCLDVCAGCFPSFATGRHNRIFHSPSVLVEQIPYARCLQFQTVATFSVAVPVEGRQERSSSSTDTHPFWKRLNHS
jgi:hypothetical protein